MYVTDLTDELLQMNNHLGIIKKNILDNIEKSKIPKKHICDDSTMFSKKKLDNIIYGKIDPSLKDLLILSKRMDVLLNLNNNDSRSEQ